MEQRRWHLTQRASTRASTGLDQVAPCAPTDPLKGGGWRPSYGWPFTLSGPAYQTINLGSPGCSGSLRCTVMLQQKSAFSSSLWGCFWLTRNRTPELPGEQWALVSVHRQTPPPSPTFSTMPTALHGARRAPACKKMQPEGCNSLDTCGLIVTSHETRMGTAWALILQNQPEHSQNRPVPGSRAPLARKQPGPGPVLVRSCPRCAHKPPRGLQPPKLRPDSGHDCAAIGLRLGLHGGGGQFVATKWPSLGRLWAGRDLPTQRGFHPGLTYDS